MSRKYAHDREVLARLKRGETLYAAGSDTLLGFFGGGPWVSHNTMRRLVVAGYIARDKTTPYYPWVLVAEGESK